MTQLGVYQTKSLGSGYSLLQEAFVMGALELVEFVPGAGGATLILRGEQGALNGLAVKAGADSRYAFHILGSYADQVLKTFYSLESTPLKDHFAVIETEDSTELFRLAEEGLRNGAVLAELKLPRGMGQAKGFLLLSSENEAVLEALNVQVKSDARFTLMKNRSAKFDALF